jgi:hypothetical protein
MREEILGIRILDNRAEGLDSNFLIEQTCA